MARITETGKITGIRQGTTGYTAAEIEALAESGELDTVKITEVEDPARKVTLDDLTPEARAEVMAEARAEVTPEPFNRIRREMELREERKARPSEGRTAFITEATERILAMVGGELTDADRANIAAQAGRTFGRPKPATPETRNAFITEATERILEMANAKATEAAERTGDFTADATAELLKMAKGR